MTSKPKSNGTKTSKLQDKVKMCKIQLGIMIAGAISLICLDFGSPVVCNPILFNPAPWSGGSMFAMPMMVGQQFDPYTSVPMPQFLLASPYSALPYESADRRSNVATSRGHGSGPTSHSKSPTTETDDQKALDDLPVSFVSSYDL